MGSKFLQWFNRKVRVQFIDHDSLTQSRLLVVRPAVMYILGMIFVLAVIAGTASLIVMTPFIREQIPGYTRPELEDDYHKQQEKVVELENQVESLDSLINALVRVYGVDHNGSDPVAFNNFQLDDILPPPADHEVAMDENPENNQFGDQEGNPEGLVVEAGANNFARQGQVMNLIPPVKGFVTNHFNPESKREKHFGIDIVAKQNSLIKSIASGFVIFSEYSNQTGYVLGIYHGNGLVSFYKHNSRLFKKVGSYVFAGEAIAVIGNSGENSTGPHLHFEIWADGKPVDPEKYVN